MKVRTHFRSPSYADPTLGWQRRRFFGGGGGGTTTETSNSSTTPWSGQQPYLSSLYSQAWTDDQQNVPQYYPSDTYAPLTGQQNNLMSNLIGNTQTGGDSSLQSANTNLSNVENGQNTDQTNPNFTNANSVLGNEMSSSFLSPSNSPAYSTAMSNAMASALPAANASFVNGNRSDSGLAQAASTSAASNAAGGLAQQQYDTNLGIQNQAAGTASSNALTADQQQLQGAFYAPMVDSQQTNDMSTALNTAGLSQTDQQNQINANVAAYNYGQMLPWNQLGLYENAITGTGSPGSSTTSSQQTPYFSNTAANVESGLGTAATVASLVALLA